MYRKYIKRILDVFFAGMIIVVLFPLMLIIAFFVRVTMGSPVLFSQQRIGKNEEVFNLSKFRSMTDEKDDQGKLLDEERRLTSFGIFLRSTSLDELPELFSILKGEMSFVGPRPLPTYYMLYFHENERIRHTVCGGLIPPDSLSLKAVTTWEEQFEYEMMYSKNITFRLDLKVIVTTFLILIKRMLYHYGSEFRPHLNQYRKNEIK